MAKLADPIIDHGFDAADAGSVWVLLEIFSANLWQPPAIKFRTMRTHLFLGALLVSALTLQTVRAQQPTTSPAGHNVVRHFGEPDEDWGLPPLPKGHASLIGGTVMRVDPIYDQLVIKPFGGKDVRIRFDVRTLLLRGTSRASIRDLRTGVRVYIDTIAVDGRLFAQTVHLDSDPERGQLTGSVLAYDPSKRLLTINDAISSQPLTLLLGQGTEIGDGIRSMPAGNLETGDLVKVTFRSATEGPSRAQKIDILAQPGSIFTFEGRISVVDFRDRYLTLEKGQTNGTFEIGLDTLSPDVAFRLATGKEVVIRARFDGHRYQAESIEPGKVAQP